MGDVHIERGMHNDRAIEFNNIVNDVFLLFEAKEIVKRQDLPKGIAPTGAYYSSDSVGPDFFSEEAEHERYSLIRNRMPFLHDLIHSKIEMWNQKRGNLRLQRKNGNSGPLEESIEVRTVNDFIEDDQSNVEALEGISHSVELEPDKLDEQRLQQVSSMTCFIYVDE